MHTWEGRPGGQPADYAVRPTKLSDIAHSGLPRRDFSGPLSGNRYLTPSRSSKFNENTPAFRSASNACQSLMKDLGPAELIGLPN